MTKLVRRDGGQPIRDAIQEKRWGGPRLARETARCDVTGSGLSPAAIGKVAGRGKTAAEHCRLRTAWLIAEALDAPLQRLFAMPSVSTDTVDK